MDFENLINKLPTKKDEAWKFTSLTEFKKISWQFPVSSVQKEVVSALTENEMQQISLNLPVEFYNLVFVNGELNEILSDKLSKLIEIQSLEDADKKIDPQHVEKDILALANACLRQKLNIKISAHQVFEKPVHILFVKNANNQKSSEFYSQRLHIHAGKNSVATIITQSINLNDSVTSLNDSAASGLNLHVNLSVDEKAKINLIQLQNGNQNSYNFSQTEIQLSSQALLTTLALTLGGYLSRNYFHLQLPGHGAEAKVYGLNAISGSQHTDHYTFIQHVAGGNRSEQVYKSILADSSHSVFRGRVRIEKNAQKADSSQLNNNLLLTRESQADSIPQLEIFADDVKAGHGSTVGQLNKDEIFYFLSRGIDQHQAVRMLSFGYAQEFIYKFEDKIIQEFLLKKIQQKLKWMIPND